MENKKIRICFIAITIFWAISFVASLITYLLVRSVPNVNVDVPYILLSISAPVFVCSLLIVIFFKYHGASWLFLTYPLSIGAVFSLEHALGNIAIHMRGVIDGNSGPLLKGILLSVLSAILFGLFLITVIKVIRARY